MIRLEIDATDLNDLRSKAMKALLLYENPATEPKPTPERPERPGPEAEVVQPAPARATETATSAEAPAPAPAKPGRGRPRGSGKNATPASEANHGAASAVTVSEPQAAVGNTASAPAVSEPPAVEGAAVAAPTFDQMKAALQSLLDSKLGSADGMAAATKILNDLGYGKVREVKPEHFAAVVAAVNARLAA